jgi:hypothetical protein
MRPYANSFATEQATAVNTVFCHKGMLWLSASTSNISGPDSMGGDDTPVNLALACPHCNRFKGPNLTSFDPETDALVPLFNPRTQSWQEHFALDDIMIVGLTPIGRATVRLLHMNAEDRLKVRAVLKERGELDI